MQQSSLFVAELHLPSIQIAAVERGRAELPRGYLGIRRGYWHVPHRLDSGGTARPDGVRIVAEFDADGLEIAEERALSFGDGFAELFSFFSGSPTAAARLVRLAEVGGHGGLLAQFNYVYDDEIYATVLWEPSELSRQLTRLASLDEDVRRKTELGVRWYARSLSIANAMDSYLAAWIGLEAIGPELDRRFHRAGDRAPCDRCGHPAGQGRDRKLAGIQHLIRTLTPEIAEDASRLNKYRDSIAHGLTDIHSVAANVSLINVDIQLCLGAGVLTLLAPPDSADKRYTAALARDWSPRPDARVEARFQVELNGLKPFLGDWADLSVETEIASSSDGGLSYARIVTPKVRFSVDLPQSNPKPSIRFVRFERFGSGVSSLEGGSPEFPSVMEMWHGRELTAAQRRIAESA